MGWGQWNTVLAPMVIPWRALAAGAKHSVLPGRSPRLPEVADQDLGKRLPAGFLLGTSTSSHQIEGGQRNDWTEWEAGAFPDGRKRAADPSGRAADSWNRFPEDLALMKALGANAYRFSVEWSRLEPERGVWSDAAAEQYLRWVTQLRAAGIEPMVTLSHFTLPVWVAAQGGWESDVTLIDFERFAGRVARLLGRQVDLWCTVNEANVLTVQGFALGGWPPGKRDVDVASDVLLRLCEAHARAARQIREHDTWDADGDGRPCLVGFAHHLRIFHPASRSPLDGTVASVADEYFNQSLISGLDTGRVRLFLPGVVDISRRIEGYAGSCDYLGINYYSRDHMEADFKQAILSRQYVPEDRPKNDLGWELYPEGLLQLLLRFSRTGLPLHVTENGIADGRGTLRSRFLHEHLVAVEEALSRGVDVRSYFHWSLLDNFEWAEGYAPRFGLYRVDWETLHRTPTPAVATFQQAAKNLRPR
jgi:beta-glucosidase